MMTITGFAPTRSGDKYVQQLVKHWSHKFDTSYADGVGILPFSAEATARLCSVADGIRMELTTADPERAETLKGVIERHIDRFAYREAPLAYSWETVA